MRVIISGGGTGGHIYPAIAIANTIKKHEPDAEIIFTGHRDGLENTIVPKAGYELYHIESCGFNRRNLLKNFRFAYLYVTSPVKGKKLIKEFRPDVVIGTGGYACWPIMKAAIDLGVPTVVHESNSIPGLAVRKMSPSVQRILVNYQHAAKLLGQAEKSVRVGNPIRDDFSVVSVDEARERISKGEKYERYILSYGGSGGADKINESAIGLMHEYVAKHPETLYVHITGQKNYESVRKIMAEQGLSSCENIILLPYTHEMSYYMAAADLVICRSGAMTISELALLRKAAILIPSPNVAANHQYHNARVLSDAGAAVLIEETELAGGVLTERVQALLKDEDALSALSRSISQFALSDANERIYQEIKKIVDSKGK